METLQREELLQYIKSAIDVETDIATQEQIGIDFQTTQENRKPSLDLEEEPECPNFDSYKKEVGNNAVSFYSFFLSILGFLLLLITGQLIWLFIMLLLCCLPLIEGWCNTRKKKERYNSDYALYSSKLQKVKQDNSQKQQEYNVNMKEWNASFESINKEIDSHLSETKAILSKLYSRNLIYPKYCTLPALTSIYEYFITGRCDDLTGPNGAYNMYEDEVRKDTVIAQLNAINENLEKIKQNQYMLYQQVVSIRENTDTISNELHHIRGYSFQIAQFTALNAYYSALNERNTRVLMYYHL